MNTAFTSEQLCDTVTDSFDSYAMARAFADSQAALSAARAALLTATPDDIVARLARANAAHVEAGQLLVTLTLSRRP